MQVIPKLLDFKNFSYLLAEADSIANPAEIHGILCGIVCSGQKMDGNFWFHTVLNLFESKAFLSPQHRHMVLDLYDSTCRQLCGLESELQLLLPGQEMSLPLRAQALSYWCQGFLYGLQLADRSIGKSASEETFQALSCISEIAQLDFRNIEIKEIDSKAYIGAVEFITDAVNSVYKEFSSKAINQIKH